MAGRDSSGSSSDAFSHALECNKTWSKEICQQKPDLMSHLAQTQTPQILWIGCSDSRCPETTLLGLQPGDVFVHRNIANILHVGDLSAQSVIAYAVGALKVKHVVLCGHTSCGGALAALGNKSLGLLDAWLAPLKQLRAGLEQKSDFSALQPSDRVRRLVEANVQAGINLLRQNGTVLQAMEDRDLRLHGCIYDVGTGRLETLNIDENETAREERKRIFSLD